jgi:hypothetical protein
MILISSATLSFQCLFMASEQACMRVSQRCREKGGAYGRLLSELTVELEELLPETAHLDLAARPGPTTLAYRQVFKFWLQNRRLLFSCTRYHVRLKRTVEMH